MTHDPAAPDPAALTALARATIGIGAAGVTADILRDVEATVTRLARAADLLRSIVDDYDGGMLPPAEAMTAVRDVVRRLPWADR